MTQQTTDEYATYLSQQLGVETVLSEYKFHPRRRWRFDYALPMHKIAIEVEGGVWTRGRHITPKGFLNDMEKYNTAASMGWMVLRITPQMRYEPETLQLIETTITTKQPCRP